jgi:ribonuclease D
VIDLTSPILPSFRFITENSEAQTALQQLQLETIVGLDTETYWNTAANKSNVSLVQIAPRAGVVLVFDLLAVDVELLRPLIESPAVTMTAHNARFDEGMLIGAGLRPLSFVDTLRLARSALRLPSYSLAGVVAHLFGIELDKSYQKSNWKRRPLSRAQLEYAAMDAHITLRVYDELRRILVERGTFDAALRAATLTPPSGEARTPRKRRAPQPPPRPLTAEERRAVAQLKKWRLRKSSEANLPAYMICPDRTLEHLVMDKPSTLEALNSINGLGPSKISRFGEELLEELKNAFNAQDAPPPPTTPEAS